jgi:hypothetical protein
VWPWAQESEEAKEKRARHEGQLPFQTEVGAARGSGGGHRVRVGMGKREGGPGVAGDSAGGAAMAGSGPPMARSGHPSQPVKHESGRRG